MKLLTLSLPKTNKRIILGSVLVLVLLAAGSYIWLAKSGKIAPVNLSLLGAKITAVFSGKKDTSFILEGINPQDLKINLAANTTNYEETAQPGEGVTHLARRALKSYLSDKGDSFNLTAEHKIYIEDYLQKKTGSQLLKLGDKVNFSDQLIAEAINQSQKLTSNQLENLKQFSALVTF